MRRLAVLAVLLTAHSSFAARTPGRAARATRERKLRLIADQVLASGADHADVPSGRGFIPGTPAVYVEHSSVSVFRLQPATSMRRPIGSVDLVAVGVAGQDGAIVKGPIADRQDHLLARRLLRTGRTRLSYGNGTVVAERQGGDILVARRDGARFLIAPGGVAGPMIPDGEHEHDAAARVYGDRATEGMRDWARDLIGRSPQPEPAP